MGKDNWKGKAQKSPEEMREIQKLSVQRAKERKEKIKVQLMPLARVGCTLTEASTALGTTREYLDEICKEEWGLTALEFFKQYRDGFFKISIRRAQFKAAMGEKRIVTKKYIEDDKEIEIETEEYLLKPSVPMLKWLGMQELGQSDKVHVGKIDELLEDGTIVVDDGHAPEVEEADFEDITEINEFIDQGLSE
jgi:hypothetical protein